MNTQLKIRSLNSPLIYVLILCFLGCSLNKPETPGDEIMPEQLELLPSEVWISDAQHFADLYASKSTAYILYTSFLDGEKEIEMHFDSERNLFLIRLIHGDAYEGNLYCEAGRLVFSEHESTVSGIEWMVAYANGKAYATAQKRDGKWISHRVEDAPIKFDAINAALLKASEFRKKEKEKTYYQRILENKKEVTATFNAKSSLSFLLNVRKNAKVKIDLINNPNAIYFIVDPNSTSNMEHQNWEGTADKSGDITITIFSIPSAANQSFTLKTRVITPQNQGYARAH